LRRFPINAARLEQMPIPLERLHGTGINDDVGSDHCPSGQHALLLVTIACGRGGGRPPAGISQLGAP
jgi:hypothetical protein